MQAIRRTGAAGLLTFFALSLFWTAPADAQSTVGVYVEPTTTLPPPPTTAAPTTTTPPPPATAAPTTAAPTTTAIVTTTTVAPSTTTTTTTVQNTNGPEDDSPQSEIAQSFKDAIVEQVQKSVVVQGRAAARIATTFISEVAAGKPVAEVAAAILPAPVATVVVPAVKTASKFAFPIGLAFAVLAFLVIQQRIDSSDPKLIAAPLAVEDDVVKFK